MKFEFVNEADQALQQLSVITERSPIEVICDALKTYEWILEEQLAGRKIVAMSGQLEDESELEDFILNKEVALKYFSK